MFRVGQQICCVHHFVSREARPDINFPTVGLVYTVRAFVKGYDGRKYTTGLLVEEITNQIGPNGVEYSFYPLRFRPLVSRKTDISIFEALLTPAGQKEPANG